MVNRIYASGWEEGVERADTHIRQFGVCFLYLLHLQRQAGAAGCGGDARSRPPHCGPLAAAPCRGRSKALGARALLLLHALPGVTRRLRDEAAPAAFPRQFAPCGPPGRWRETCPHFFWHLHAPYCASEGQTTGAELPRDVGLCYFSNSPCCPETLPHSHPPQQSL